MDAIVYDKVGKEAEKVREALYGIYPQETITDAAIASFDDGADGIPVKALTVGVEPVQDLHGYDNPWPAGGGKNKLKITAATQIMGGVTFTVNADGSILANGTANSFITLWLTGRNDIQLPTGSYIASGCTGGSYKTYFLAFDCGGQSSVLVANGDTALVKDENTQYVYPRISINEGVTLNNVLFQPMIRLATEADATFAPYENLCPISGWTGAEISNAAVNIWDEDWANGYYDTSGNFVSSNNYVCSKNKIMVEPDTLYYLHFPVAMTIRAFDSNQQFIGTAPGTWRNETFKPAGYFSGVRYITFNSAASGAVTTYNNDISINYPATDTEYHPYTGNQISVTLPSEAGTVYGARMTLNSDKTGTLTVTHVSVDASNVTWSLASSNRWTAIGLVNVPDGSAGDGVIANGLIAEKYKSTTNNQLVYGMENAVAIAANNSLLVKNGSTTDKPTGRIVYPIADPQIIQLTASEVSGILNTLYGQNNVWANTGNIKKLTYRADLGKYIDSHITTAVADALNA